MRSRIAALLAALVVLVCSTGPGSPLAAQTGQASIAKPFIGPWSGMTIGGVESTVEGRTRVTFRYARASHLTILDADTVTITGTAARLDVLTAGPTTLSHRPAGVSSPDPQYFGALRLSVRRDAPAVWQIPAR